MFNQTHKITFYSTLISTTVLKKKNQPQLKVLFIKYIFLNHNHKSYYNTKQTWKIAYKRLK